MASTIQYQPLDSNRNEIRLISVFHGEPSSTLHAHLFHVSLDIDSANNEPPAYDALSYCWSDVTGIREAGQGSGILRRIQDFIFPPQHTHAPLQGYIDIDGKLLSLAPNLEAALRRLRSPTEDLIIWIDAICINQDKISERNEQVRKMRHIYGAAKTVRVWLGESYGESAVAFELLRIHSRHLDSVGEGPIVPQETWQFECLLSLWRRPYWERVWVIQEIASAKVVNVHCGEDVIEWQHICKASLALAAITSELLFYRYNFQDIATIAQGGPQTLKRLGNGQLQVSSKPLSHDLLDLLLDNCSKKATDPKDKVYALLGMSTARADHGMVHRSRELLWYSFDLEIPPILTMIGAGLFVDPQRSLHQCCQLRTLIIEEFEYYLRRQFEL